jgi:hypothetical protein
MHIPKRNNTTRIGTSQSLITHGGKPNLRNSSSNGLIPKQDLLVFDRAHHQLAIAAATRNQVIIGAKGAACACVVGIVVRETVLHLVLHRVQDSVACVVTRITQ